MTSYIVRRVLIAAGMLLVASAMAYGIMKLAPGDYFARLTQDTRVSQEYIRQQRAKYRLDSPVYIQYAAWLRNFLRGDLGYSFEYKRPVSELIGERLLNTLLLNVVSIVLTWLVAIPLGVYAAVRQYSRADKLLSSIAFMGMSLPGFFLALLFLYLFSGVLGWLPAGGLKSLDYDQFSAWGKLADLAAHLAIPVVVLVIGALAGLQRIMRGNMLDILRQQYIVTARAKGLPENRVIYKHALRNAINPLVTIFGYEFAALFSGAALLEIITSYPGLGFLLFNAVRAKDEFLVMGGFMMGAVMLLIGNLLADVLLAVVDPRISYA
jgi:peptide/nickel transport system permease protein